MTTTTDEAEREMIDKLVRELKSDEGYRLSWEANIACAIMDTKQQPGEPVHGWRNRCAKTFINRLIGHPELPDDIPGALGVAASVEPIKAEDVQS